MAGIDGGVLEHLLSLEELFREVLVRGEEVGEFLDLSPLLIELVDHRGLTENGLVKELLV